MLYYKGHVLSSSVETIDKTISFFRKKFARVDEKPKMIEHNFKVAFDGANLEDVNTVKEYLKLTDIMHIEEDRIEQMHLFNGYMLFINIIDAVNTISMFNDRKIRVVNSPILCFNEHGEQLWKVYFYDANKIDIRIIERQSRNQRKPHLRIR